MNSAPETHYVFVVHGTWNPPRADERLWYQLDPANPDNFCTRLNEELQALGIGPAVGRECMGVPAEFSWSGDNTHEARIVGAKALAQRIVEISTRDPTARIHLVAHSHGGNVALAAIQLYLSYLQFQSEVVWNFDDPARRVVWTGFMEGPPDELDPRHLPPVEASARAFGVGNDALLSARWQEARAAFAAETGGEDAAAHVPPRAKGPPRVDDAIVAGREPLGRFSSWWMQSATRNRLGRVVFLGTPFYFKRWGTRDDGKSRRWFTSRWRDALLELPFWWLALAVPMYLAVQACWLLVAWALSGLHVGIPWPRFDPLAWPWALHAVWALPLLAAIGLTRLFTQPLPWTNLYCEETYGAYHLVNWPLDLPQRALPVPALVVTAGLLDEVMALMAAEPIIKAALDHQVSRSLWEQGAPRTGLATGMTPGYFAPKVRALAMRLSSLAGLALRPVVWVGRKLLERYLQRTLFALLKSAAFGVDPADLRDARLDVSVDPKLRYIMQAHTWRIPAQIAREPPHAATADTVARYAFLWDPRSFEEKLRTSWLIPRIRPLMARSRHPDDAPLDGATAMIALSLEERMREIIGLVDLAHSHYYSNREVISRIARFIARVELPPEE